MMEKIVLKAQNEEELKNMVSRSLTLKEDETYQVKVLKHPKKILFINIKGEYEIEIVKKSDLKSSDVKSEKLRIQNEEKFVKKEKKDTKNQSNIDSRKNSNRKNYRNENSENEEKISQNSQDDTNIDKIRGFFKEFIVNAKLDIKIINVKKEVDTKAATFVNKEDIARYKSEVKDDLYLIRKDMFLMKEDIFKEIHKIRSEANQNKFDLIKWFISLFITLALMIIGLYLK